MKQEPCPKLNHFHAVYEQVGSFKRPNKTIISESPMDALELFLPFLPTGWRGGISIFDDELGHEDEMPLVHQYVL